MNFELVTSLVFQVHWIDVLKGGKVFTNGLRGGNLGPLLGHGFGCPHFQVANILPRWPHWGTPVQGSMLQKRGLAWFVIPCPGMILPKGNIKIILISFFWK